MSILLTGATGFIGGAVATALAERGLTNDTQFAVRASTVEQGLDRLRNNLARFGVSTRTLMSIDERQIIRFDLRSGPIDPLAKSTQRVINCAALATFSSHPSLWDVNVGGVVRFAKLALESLPRLSRFVQVGTAMSCGRGPSRHIFEDWHVPPQESHVVPYTFSKGMAELALRSQLPDLPLIVARPSIVIGHTRLGCRPSGSIFWVLRIIALLEACTCELSDRIDVISSDDCAEALVQLSLKPTLAHDLYHLSAGEAHAETVATLYPLLRDCRHPAEFECELQRYERVERIGARRLARKVPDAASVGNLRLMHRAVQAYSEFARMGYVFDNARLQEETGFLPSSFKTYIDRCIETSREESIIEQMRWDYKRPANVAVA